nr:hypothetical protein [Tanacetum cinerariifolium]
MRVVPTNYDPKGERFLIASRFPTPPLACAFFSPGATVTCAKCGHPVNGPYCQGCALLREKLEEDLVTYLKYFQDTFESSDESTNVVNAPREPVVVKKDQGINPPHIDKCCCECGNALDGIFCQQCICKSCGKGAHTGYNCPPKVSIISNPKPCNQTMNNEPPQTSSSFDSMCYPDKEKSVPCISKPNFVNESSNIFNPPPQPPIYSCKFCGSNAQYGHYCTPQAPFINLKPGYSQDLNFSQNIHDFQQQYLCCDQCGGPHETFQCQQVISFEPCCENCKGPHENFQCQPLNYCEPNPSYDSYYSGFDQFDEFIKSCVETLVPNPSESERENGCDVQACFITFSNILFDADDESDSSDYQSCSDEDFPEEIFSNPLFEEEIISIKIDQHHFNAESDLVESLLNRDSSIISSSSKTDSLLDEFADELTLLKSISPGVDETDCYLENEICFAERLLYKNSSPRLPEEFVSNNSNAETESFSPSPIPNEDSDPFMEEIDLFLTPDDLMPPSIEYNDDDSERDILIHKELLDNYSLSLPINKSYYFDIPSFSCPPTKPPDGNTGTLNIKMMGDVSDQKVSIPNLTITRVSNQEKSPDLLSHRGLEFFKLSAKCPMMIHEKNIPILDVSLFHFYPLDQS